MMNHKFLAALLTSSALIGTPTLAAEAAADTPQVTVLTDVVVTAERRETSVQDTPLAVTALGGEALAQKQVNTIEGLNTLVPNLNFARYSGTAQIAIRGVAFDAITPGAEGRTAVYNDGAYISRPAGALVGFFDVQRVEVLRGPQGTLYGRNATAGAINVITRDPTRETSGYGMVTIGDYSRVQTEGAVSGALGDSVAVRLAFQTSDHAGFGHNIRTGQEIDNERTRAARLKVLVSPNEAFDLKLTANYYYGDDASGARHDFGQGRPDVVPRGLVVGGVLPADPRDYGPAQPHYRRDVAGLDAEANWRLSENLKLVSLTGYHYLNRHLQTVTDGTTAQLSAQDLYEKSKQFSQEIRLNYDTEHLHVVGGGYYFHENNSGRTFTRLDGGSALPGPPGASLGVRGVLYYGADFGGVIHTDAYAAFSQAEVDLTSQLSLTVGARYSAERKQIAEYSGLDLATPYVPGMQRAFPISRKSKRFSSFDPKASLNYRPNDDILIYLSYSRGFKSGGFALGALTPAFAPEKLTDYEAGVKADLLDRRLRVNLGAFYYSYRNLQVTKVNGTVVTTENAANATIKGLEAEVQARPTAALELGLNVSLLNATFDKYVTSEPARPALGSYSLEGNSLAQSPKSIVTLSGRYTWPLGLGDLSLSGDVTWKSRIYFSPYNRPEISQSAYSVANVALSYKVDGWTTTAFVRNLTNEEYRVSSTVGNVFAGFPIGGQLGDPRTVGVSVTKAF